MKKLVFIVLLNIYAVAVFGIGIKQFYCCGILKSTNFSLTEGSSKKCDNGDEKDGCCKTEYKNFKVKDSHFAAGDVITPAKQSIDIHLFTPSFPGALGSIQRKEITNLSNAPPLLLHSELNILNCVYRI